MTSTPLPPPSHEFKQWNSHGLMWRERLFHGLLAGSASVLVLIAIAITLVFGYEAWLFFQQVSLWEFFTDRTWAPLFDRQQCGIWVIATATILVALIALIVAVPLGILAAIYLSEYAHPRMRQVLKPTLEAIAGIPTIVFGYFALLVVTPFLRLLIPALGTFNALSAGLVTGILITPLISSISEDAIEAVPHSLRQGAYAIGFTQREVIHRIILPVAFPGIMAAITLAASRALGETMIAAIAAGQTPVLTLNPLTSMETMTAFIVHVSLGDVSWNSFVFRAVFTVGLVLFLLTLSLNWLGHWLIRRHRRQMQGFTIPNAESSVSRTPTELPTARSSLPPLTAAFPDTLEQRDRLDGLFHGSSLIAAWVGLGVLGVLLVVLVQQGLPYLNWHFLSNFSSRNAEDAGIYAALVGTTWVMGLTACLAVPIGLGTAIYLEEYVPPSIVSDLLEIHIANLAAIPSILYGLLGLALFARAWKPFTGGYSLLSAAFVLAVIVLPFLIIATRTALRSVPEPRRQAGYAVGMTRWQVLRYVTLPTAAPAILTGVLLALSQVIGETAALVAVGAAAFVSFVPDLSLSALQSGYTTLPTQIFYWATRPQPEFQGLAAATIIVLGAIVLAINVAAVLLRDLFPRR